MALTQITTDGIKDGAILNADLNASAAIAGTKIAPDFGSQNIVTTGQVFSSYATLTAVNPTLTFSDSDNNPDYTINVNSGILKITDSTNSADRLTIDADGRVKVNTANLSNAFQVDYGGGFNLVLDGAGVLKQYRADGTSGGFTIETALTSGSWGNTTAGFVSLKPRGTQTFISTPLTTEVHNDFAIKSSLAKMALIDNDGGDIFQLRNDAGTFIIHNSTDSKNALTIDGACVTSILNATPPATNVTVLHVSNNGSATTLGTSATCRISNNGGNAAYSVFEAESGSGSIRLANDGQFYVSGASKFSNMVRTDINTGSDGFMGEAYSGYFGLKHTDQTINSEYMIISNDTNTYISCSSGSSIYLRPSANSPTHETVFAHDNTTYKTNIVMNGHNITRSDFSAGFLVGAQNNQGASDAKTNPIFSIGTSHLPTNTALGDMYGIGFSHGNATFTPPTAGWGMYACADGDARIFLDTSNARIYFGSNIVSTPRFISAPTGNYGSIQINNGAVAGWRGYSIDGHSVFMSNGTTAVSNYIGIYDDNVNQWALLHARTAWVRLYYGSGLKFETTNAGVYIHGTLTATSTKSFRISHPLSELSETKDLVHAAIEGPQMDLMYRGKVDLVNGTATVNIDTKSGMTEGTFDVLNRDVQCFTTNETGWTNVKGSVTGNKLTIVAENNSCTDTISWMVIGERKDNGVVSSEVTNDNGDLIVEPDKQIIDDDPKMDS